jgi:uncharacterized protein involved in response to NO
MVSLADRSRAPSGHAEQEPFQRVAPVLKAALVIGASGGFVLAAVLTVTEATGANLGVLWSALVQAHGHLQLYGWAGLFVVGVALHFMPRLRGAPLAAPHRVRWMLGALVTSLVLRVAAEPLVATTGAVIWRAALFGSGLLECFAVAALLSMLALTARSCRRAASSSPELTIAPLVVSAFVSLGAAALVNAFNMAQAAWSPVGIVPAAGDDVNVTLGLFGFLVPMTLAMSVQMLPMYAGIAVFPKRIVLPSAAVYEGGLALLLVGTAASGQSGTWAGVVASAGSVLLGATLVGYVALFVWLMRARERHVPRAPAATRPPQAGGARHVSTMPLAYGPFVSLVASAYLWALVGGALLLIDGVVGIIGSAPPINPDAVRHSITVGYVALLICGVSPRMIPGFSRGRIASPRLVRATLWLGNGAALLRVGALVAAPMLAWAGAWARQIDQVAFGLSGPLGLLLAVALAVNLWPALGSPPARQATSVA